MASSEFSFLGWSLVHDRVTPSQCRSICLPHIRLLWIFLFGQSPVKAEDSCNTGASHARQLTYLTLQLSLHFAHLPHLITYYYYFGLGFVVGMVWLGLVWIGLPWWWLWFGLALVMALAMVVLAAVAEVAVYPEVYTLDID